MDTVLDYKNLHQWPNVPTQAEVQERIDAASAG